MADYFASIFGTEKDKVNCSFYFKIGACRHGDRCSRVHNKPSFSQTILLQNLYENPRNSTKSDGQYISDEEDQRHFDQFFEDIYVELEEKYGPIEEMNVCDNLGDHLIGNVYVKFKSEEDAELAVEELNVRWFGGKPVYAELSTVTDFREAGCRQYEIGACTRGGFCNFMHLKQISDSCRRYLFGSSKGSSSSAHRSTNRSHKSHKSRSRSRSRSSSISRRHDSSHRRDNHRRRRSRRSHKSSSTRRRTPSLHRHRSHSRSRSRSLSPAVETDVKSSRARMLPERSPSPVQHTRRSLSRSSSKSRTISPSMQKKRHKPAKQSENALISPKDSKSKSKSRSRSSSIPRSKARSKSISRSRSRSPYTSSSRSRSGSHTSSSESIPRRPASSNGSIDKSRPSYAIYKGKPYLDYGSPTSES